VHQHYLTRIGRGGWHIAGALAERGLRARTIAVGSLGGVNAASRGECDIAPVHLVDAATGIYNKHLLEPGLALVPGWRRMQGFVFRSGDARFEGLSAEAALQAALADPAILMVNRNAGSGTRVLIDSLLRGAKPVGYANTFGIFAAMAMLLAIGLAVWVGLAGLLGWRALVDPGRVLADAGGTAHPRRRRRPARCKGDPRDGRRSNRANIAALPRAAVPARRERILRCSGRRSAIDAVPAAVGPWAAWNMPRYP